MALYSQSPAVDARSLLLSGMRPPKFLDKEDVDSIFQKLHDALRDEIVHNRYQDNVDHNVEEWVAKAILVRGLAFNGSTVSDFFEICGRVGQTPNHRELQLQSQWLLYVILHDRSPHHWFEVRAPFSDTPERRDGG